MSNTEVPSDERRREAIERLRKRAEFSRHLAAYVLVNALLVGVWFLSDDRGLFWPMFPLFGWGIGLFFHGLDTFRRPFSEERIRREMDRLP